MWTRFSPESFVINQLSGSFRFGKLSEAERHLREKTADSRAGNKIPLRMNEWLEGKQQLLLEIRLSSQSDASSPKLVNNIGPCDEHNHATL